MAFSSLAALAAGEAVTAAVVLGAVAEVGVAMSVVGAVTGNKDLIKLGSVMGLVGGVGGMISGGISGAGGATALGEAGTEAALASASTEAAGAFGGNAAVDSMTDSLVSGMESAAPSMASETAAMQLPNPAMQAGAAPAAAPIIQSNAVQPVADTIAQGPAGVQGPAGAQTPIGAQGPATPWESDFQSTAALSGTNAPQPSGSFWNSFSTFAKNNQKLLAGGMQMVGGALKGANDRDMFDQRLALEQQRVNQTSYGNTVANTTPRSIIAGARA